MDKQLQQIFIDTLKRELVPALGCTEPIAIAYCAAKARETLGEMPTHLDIRCSGNIVKNVQGVTVPNSKGLRGIDVAAVLGVVGGDPTRELEVLEGITDEHIEKTKALIAQGFVKCYLQEDVENLYIVATASTPEHRAEVTIVNRHTLITKIMYDDKVLFEQKPVEQARYGEDWDHWSIRNILAFADEVDVEEVREVLQNQIEKNSAIAAEGLSGNYGARVGKTLLEAYGSAVHIRARARAAAGSDARMGGCSMPVVINSGSGNQGMTVSLPVLEYARELCVSEEKLYRALIVSNLVSIYQKHFIGSLSAFCGAVTAACGCGAAITYLCGGSYEQICMTIVNTVANVGGMVCDGAKASCAAKIASAVDAAITGHHMSMRGRFFQPGEGFVQKDIEETIKSLGYIGRVGMKETDAQILKIMLGQVDL